MSSSPELDVSYLNRAVPPGSLRYFSLLYAPPEKREVLTAMYVIDAEIREAARGANHDVAHARLQWWRAEIDRLANHAPQHPATRLLARTGGGTGFARLHELLAAADMDLARLTYGTGDELRAYCSRSGGTICELIGEQLQTPREGATPDDALRVLAHRLGIGIRMSEILRDVRQDAWEGRVYLPLDLLDHHGIDHERLRSGEVDARLQAVLEAFAAEAYRALRGDTSTTRPEDRPPAATPGASPARHAALRPLHVLAGLHERLLDRIASRHYDIASQRVELGPIEKSWRAWREARRA